MGFYNKLAAMLAAGSMLVCNPQGAIAGTPTSDAAKLRQLDIMLMVTSLRCRFGDDNFQADYARFSSNQNKTMQDAFKTLQADYSSTMGPAGASKALDKMSVGMANQYGQGHPWLGCAELKTTTRDLSQANDRAALIAAADELLAERPYAGSRFAARR
jgi:hypothetical protein